MERDEVTIFTAFNSGNILAFCIPSFNFLTGTRLPLAAYVLFSLFMEVVFTSYIL